MTDSDTGDDKKALEGSQDDAASSEGAEAATPGEEAMDESRMSLLEHLSELRYRLRNAFIAFFVAMFVCYGFKERILEMLTRPIRSALKAAGLNVRLVTLHPTEMFWVYFKLAIGCGVLLSAPFILWEMWRFVAPGLYRKEKKLALGVVMATGLCFTGGALFGYMALTEPAVKFLASFVAENFGWAPDGIDMVVENMFSIEKVVEFEVMMLLGCGIAFELPVILSLMGALGIVSAGGLWRFNKYSLVLSALLGGILTPGGDVVSQLLLAGPIFVLYNLSILVVKAIEKTRKKKMDDIEASYEDEA